MWGNAVIGQSGGPTAVINQSLVGVIESIKGFPKIGRLLGARHGVSGIVQENFIDLKGIKGKLPRLHLQPIFMGPREIHLVSVMAPATPQQIQGVSGKVAETAFT